MADAFLDKVTVYKDKIEIRFNINHNKAPEARQDNEPDEPLDFSDILNATYERK